MSLKYVVLKGDREWVAGHIIEGVLVNALVKS
jgi:hypothetical protein